MSNLSTFAPSSACATCLLVASGYLPTSAFSFGELNPPFGIHAFAAYGIARNFMSAIVALSSLNATATLPPPTTDAGEPSIDGKL